MKKGEKMKKICLLLLLLLLVVLTTPAAAAQKEVGTSTIKYSVDGDTEIVKFRYLSVPVISTMLVKYPGGNSVPVRNGFFDIRIKKQYETGWVVENVGDTELKEIPFQTGFEAVKGVVVKYSEWRANDSPVQGQVDGANLKLSLAPGEKIYIQALGIAEPIQQEPAPVTK